MKKYKFLSETVQKSTTGTKFCMTALNDDKCDLDIVKTVIYQLTVQYLHTPV